MRLVLATVVALLVCLVVGATAEAAITLRSDSGAQLARFKNLKCKQGKAKGFTGTARSGAWRLSVRINPFAGYKRNYKLLYGPAGPAIFRVSDGTTTYSNTVEAKEDSLPVSKGGNLGFPGGREKIGISFGTAFVAGEPAQYGSLFGLATCSY